MGDYTKAEFEGMAQGRADFASVYGSFEDTLNTLNGQIQSNLAEWSGSAQAAYEEAKRIWNAAANDMSNVLNQLGNVVGVAHDNYVTTEGVNTRLWA
jgi:WXG100 family type VII secretion target